MRRLHSSPVASHGSGPARAPREQSKHLAAASRSLSASLYPVDGRSVAAACGHRISTNGQLRDEADGEAVGGIGVVLQSDVERVSAEVGYWLGESFWGQGIGTAALQRFTTYAFGAYDVSRVNALPFGANVASRRVSKSPATFWRRSCAPARSRRVRSSTRRSMRNGGSYRPRNLHRDVLPLPLLKPRHREHTG